MTGNLTLALGGASIEGAVFFLVMCSVRRNVRQRAVRQRPVRAIATIARPEVPAGRRELTR